MESMTTTLFRTLVALMGAICIAIVLAASFLHFFVNASPAVPMSVNSSEKERTASEGRPIPLVRRRVSEGVRASEYEMALGRMRLTPGASLSAVIHAMHLGGPSYLVPHPTLESGMPAIETILNNQLAKEYYKGAPPLVTTRFGVRCRLVVRRDASIQPEREAHSGQLLAAFAEAGIPLSTVLTTSTNTHTVADLLKDSIATFSLEEPQIEWLATGLALYLAPKKTWTNKFGNTFSFDDLAQHLMQSRFDDPELSCRGIHLLYSLAVIYQVDLKTQILSEALHRRLTAFLATWSLHLSETQLATGRWPDNWSESQPGAISPPSEGIDRVGVIVVGHHLEWLYLLPEGMVPPDRSFILATRWLLEKVRLATQEQLHKDYCPFSHAVFSIGQTSS
jgi:hypothetical protein